VTPRARTRPRGLVIFDAFNTLVTARPGSEDTFLAGLREAGLDASVPLLAELQAACEGLDHSVRSGVRQAYVDWAADTLSKVGQAGGSIGADLAPRVVPALEQLHQAPMVALPGAAACLRTLKASGFAIAVCSNWGWDLRQDLEATGLTADIDVLVTSARAGWRKPHPRIYRSTLGLAGFGAGEAVFVGDSFRTDFLGPRSVGIRPILLARQGRRTFDGEQAGSLATVSRLLITGMPDAGHSGGAGPG
jgi:FMN phosphatase YigB (HAD superfamily)